MPEMTQEEMEVLFELLEKNVKRANISIQEEAIAKKEAEEYFNNKDIDISKLSLYSIYFIIKNLSSDEQINFIKDNINYIKENDEDIFLYNFMYPKPLVNYLSYNVIKEIKNIDSDIAIKLMNCCSEYLFNGFLHDDYINYYKDFFDIIINNDISLSAPFREHSKLYLKGINFVNITKDNYTKLNDIQNKYNKELILLVLNKYKDKINDFTPCNLAYFLSSISDKELYEEFLLKNKDKLNCAFKSMSDGILIEYLEENVTYEKIFLDNFFDIIINKRDIKKYIYKINIKYLINKYYENREIFKDITLLEWVKLSSEKRYFEDDLINVLDEYDVVSIEDLFDTNYYTNRWVYTDFKALEYIEMKYRKNITNVNLKDINDNVNIFSNDYINNLKTLNINLKNNNIDKNSFVYIKHLNIFINFLKNISVIFETNEQILKELEKFFYKIVMGNSLTNLYKVKNIKDIILLNRIGEICFYANDFSIEQLINFNIKEFKILTTFINNKNVFKDLCRFILKLYLLVGFSNTKRILGIDCNFQTLEHLVGSVSVNDIKLDENNKPILNDKIINLLFNKKETIMNMLHDKECDLYSFFPRLFNEFDMIKSNINKITLNNIVEYLKGDNISIPPKYYKLEGLFKFIGCNSDVVKETYKLHDDMLNRNISSIPRVNGEHNGYTYEVLKLKDMEGIAVGNRTNCCFTVLGNAYSSLRNAVTNKDGRILVIKKDGVIVAHSWLWRNGNVLCLDNIEVAQKIYMVDFFDVYIKFIIDIVDISKKYEGVNGIENVTIGYTSFDKVINGINNYLCMIKNDYDTTINDVYKRLGNNKKIVSDLPKPREDGIYTDARNVQYLIYGKGNFKYYDPIAVYEEKEEPLYYDEENNEYYDLVNKEINSLRYKRFENDKIVENFNYININSKDKVYCTKDWYIIKNDKKTEYYINSNDDYVINEFNYYKNLVEAKKLVKVI